MLDGWKSLTIGSLIDPARPITYGVVQPGEHDPNGVPLVRGGDFSGGWKPIEAYRRVAPEIERSFARARLKAGDVVITIKGALVGSAAIVPSFLDGANVSQTNARMAIDSAKADARFVLAFLESSEGKKQIGAACQIGAQPGLIFRDIEELELLLPPLPEQHKIADILQTWDEAIENLRALKEAKTRALDALAGSVIHGSQHDGQLLRKHLIEVSERNRGQKVDRVLSVTNSSGFVLSEEQFAHRVASIDISGYKVVRRGQYAYNPSRINVGSIARLEDWDAGALSPMYVVFEVGPGLNSEFFGHWLRSAEARQRIALTAQGSVRKTVSFSDLGSIEIPVPPIANQLRIAGALNAARDELKLIDTHAGTLLQQKRGLMQKLLTGEWRVEA